MTKEEAINLISEMWELLFQEITNHTFESLAEIGRIDEYKSALDMAISVLKSGWIPVSKRLPEERTAVLVYVPEWKNIYCAYYEPKNEQWWIFGTYTKLDFEVVAWQPLPEPYKEVSE